MSSERVNPTWPENQWPTAKQWAAWFVANPPAEQAAIAERVLKASQEAGDCFLRNHASLEREVAYLRTRAARYRLAWVSARRWRIAMNRYLRGETAS